MGQMASDKVLKIGKNEFEEIPETAVAASRWLVEIWERLGKPDTPLTEAGAKLMNVIITVWEELYPQDAVKWYENRRDYKASELSIQEQLKKHTGRSLASYPFPVFQIMRKLFPKFKPGDRASCMKLVTKWPMFLMAVKK